MQKYRHLLTIKGPTTQGLNANVMKFLSSNKLQLLSLSSFQDLHRHEMYYFMY